MICCCILSCSVSNLSNILNSEKPEGVPGKHGSCQAYAKPHIHAEFLHGRLQRVSLGLVQTSHCYLLAEYQLDQLDPDSNELVVEPGIIPESKQLDSQ